MSVQDVMVKYRQQLGKSTKVLSFEKMAKAISEYKPVGQNTLYSWTSGRGKPVRWRDNLLALRSVGGWVGEWAGEMLAAIDGPDLLHPRGGEE